MYRSCILIFYLITTVASQADVVADFSNVGPVDSGTFQRAVNTAGNDTITLAYTIDGTGNVSLNASTTNTNTTFVNLVNQFDRPGGTAGSTTNSSFFNSAFSLKITPVRETSATPRLSITTLDGGGLGVEGENANLVDGRTLSAGEFLVFELTAPRGMTLRLKNWSWVSGTGADLRFDNGTAFQDFVNLTATGSAVFDSSSNPLMLENGDTLTFGETPTSSNGSGLETLAFEILGSPVAADTVVSFANSGTGFGPTPPYILSGSNTAPITLNFSINSSGVISLDASTTSTSTVFINMVNEWDETNAGSVANPSWFNTSFTLRGIGSGGANLAITELGGGGIGIQGENANRVDGLNYGTGGSSSTPETLSWTLSGAPDGMSLNFKNWSYVEGNGSDIRVSNGATVIDFPNNSGATGTLALPDLALKNGESLTFKEIPGIGATDGAGIAGFTFSLTGLPGFDNGAGNNLWTNAANWSPDGLPAAPANALIDGYDVILNTAAGFGPDELVVANGSLTVTASGSLAMRAMTIGADNTKPARLVINGSSVSFGSTGSSASDRFVVGPAGTIETKPDAAGSEPLELGAARLVLEPGAQWIVDGANAGGISYSIGTRIVLANFGSFEGEMTSIRTRNFDLPSNRRLDLVATSTSLYYEVVDQPVSSGPNIIIINTDDQAADQHFGFDGRNCLTPTLDSLVSTGIKFNLAFCASPVCGSSRYSLLTSRWPSRNTSDNFISKYPLGALGRFGVSDTELEHDRQNIGAWLQQSGYRTGFVGKCHVLDDSLHATANWTAAGLLTYSSTADPATDSTANAAMQFNHRLVCQKMRAHGFDYVDAFYHANLKELFNTKLNVHNQEWVTSRALRFIEENRHERFFLYMAPTINHGPVNDNLDFTLNADPRYTSAGYLPNEDYSFMPSRQSIVNQVLAAGKAKISARETWLDYSVKAIVDKLTAYGIRNDTLIIFTSDHGEKTLSSPVVWGKTTLYDLGMKVPMVMNWPNGIAAPNRHYNELVSHVDIVPTLLALAGGSNLPTRPVDGVSLLPVLQGDNSPVRNSVFAEIGYARGVRTKSHKYISVRYTPAIYTQISQGYKWQRYTSSAATGEFTEPRPYYINNTSLGALGSETNPNYYSDDQLYNLNADAKERTNIYGQNPTAAYDLKKLLANYIGSIPNRPFRQFGDASAEFAPAPSTAPLPPSSLGMEFLNLDQVRLSWSDVADNELGYIIRKSINGSTPTIVGEYPPGTTSANVAIDSGIQDIVIEVASYNALGDTIATQDLLSPESWRYRTFGSHDPNLSQSASQWEKDPDGDGVTTRWEYAFGTDPLSAASVAKPRLQITPQPGNRFLEYVLPRDRRRGMQFRGLVTSDLMSWQSGAAHCTVAEDGPYHMTFRSKTPVHGATRQFIRVEMIDPPGGQP